MKKTVIALAALGAGVAFASPAAAQYNPYGYANPYGQNGYGYGYGYGNGMNDGAVLMNRANRLASRIAEMDRRNLISTREAVRMQRDLSDVRQRLAWSARNGINPGEYRSASARLENIERRLYQRSRDRYDNRYDRYDADRYGNRAYGYPDRDRDGRDDRYENDRGTRHDRDHD